MLQIHTNILVHSRIYELRTVLRANSEQNGLAKFSQSYDKYSSSNINRTFAQNYLALNNIIETLAQFLNHSWNVSL